jgi:hypothetical protein
VFLRGVVIELIFIGTGVLLAAIAWAAYTLWHWRQQRAQLMGRVSDLSAHVDVLENSTSQAIIRFETTGIIRTVSAAAAGLFGYTADELLGQSILKLVPEALSNTRLSHTVEVRRKDGSFVHLPFEAVKSESARRLRRPPKFSYIYLFFGNAPEVFGNPPHEPAPNPGVVQEPKMAETRASAHEPLNANGPMNGDHRSPPIAARIVGRIVGQFENLFTVINGYSGLALMEIPENGPGRRELQEIAAAGEHASSLTRHLAAFTGNQSVVARHVDLNRLIEGMKAAIRNAIPCPVDFDLHPLGAHPLANADSLREAILLLCGHARQREAGRLEVRTRFSAITTRRTLESGQLKPGMYASLVLFDTGRALDMDGPDLGVELSPVYGAVLGVGGGIDIKSSASKGTVFEILLPCG